MLLVMFLIVTSVSLNACAQLFLKYGLNKIGHFTFTSDNILPIGLKIASNLPIIGGLSCYAISLVLWMMVLSRADVSFAYPMLSIGYIINAVAAYYLFNENLSLERILGIGIIIVGVYLITRGAP